MVMQLQDENAYARHAGKNQGGPAAQRVKKPFGTQGANQARSLAPSSSPQKKSALASGAPSHG